jgi:hypothetical protein
MERLVIVAMKQAAILVCAAVIGLGLAGVAGCTRDRGTARMDAGLDLPGATSDPEMAAFDGGREWDASPPADDGPAGSEDARAQDGRGKESGPAVLDGRDLDPGDLSPGASTNEVSIDLRLDRDARTVLDGSAAEDAVTVVPIIDADALDLGLMVDTDATEVSDAGGDRQSGDAVKSADGAASPDGGQERIWVYLMAGQSNMVGLGRNGLLPREYASSVDRATIYYNDSIHPNPNAEQWLPLSPGFGCLADLFGPELSFGIRMRELYPRRRLAIIKVAEGGTGLFERWKAETGELYNLLLGETRAQLRVLAGQGIPQIAGLLWMQGESDTGSLATAKAYEQNLRDFVSALRRDLGSPLMPVVAGLISTEWEWVYADIVRDATTSIAEQVGRMSVVETSDLTMLSPPDAMHYDTDGSFRLGLRYAEAVAAMQATRWRFPDDFSATQGDACWSYRDCVGDADSPLVFDRGQGAWVGDKTGVQLGQGAMIPGATHQAGLSWWAPFAGDIDVSFSAAVPSWASKGVQIAVTGPSGAILGPTGVEYPTRVWYSFKASVAPGDQFHFRTAPGPAPDSRYDATNWQIDVTMNHVDE